ncbi:hypothetical protein C8D94_101989 [Marinirhabdus gelatinilytica]|uniref:Uncharacterized protein n=2 Tax=Marinirhabdus gelatinilytica TaxID=1703343 RepID=A0A370QL93_9FLAO|nr:hypothetical protein C8D94_101989 [Marinirhabdus gelatinilytica]
MCVLLMASTSGVAYAQHFCGDFEMLATVTLGEEKLTCSMATSQDDDCDNEDAEDHDCCDSQYIKISTDDNFNASQDTFQLPTNFVAAFVSVFVLQNDVSLSDETPIPSEYIPPALTKDIPVLYEFFLI